MSAGYVIYVSLCFLFPEGVWGLLYTYRRGLLRCSFDSDGQCEGLNAWDGQSTDSCAFLFYRPFISLYIM